MTNAQTTEIVLEDVITKYNEGQSPYQIAKHYDTYPNRIRRMLKKADVPIRGKSDAQKASLESGVSTHPTKGKTRSSEEKLNISASLTTYWDGLSDAERDKRSEISKENWKNMPAIQKQKMLDAGREAIRRASKEGSKLERKLVDFLEEEKYNVDFHNVNLIPMEKLEIDIYIPALKVIVEVDGPSHFLPIWGEDRFQKQEEYDLRKNGLLLSKGFVIIRVKALNDPTLSRTHELCKRILGILQSVEREFPVETERFIEVEL